jgi:hypothetical protein
MGGGTALEEKGKGERKQGKDDLLIDEQELLRLRGNANA